MINSNPVLFWIIIIGVVILLISINVSLFSMLRDHSLHNQIKITQRMAKKIQSPWQDEENDLAELSRIVDKLDRHTNEPDQNKPA
jgi:hypothetical protein